MRCSETRSSAVVVPLVRPKCFSEGAAQFELALVDCGFCSALACPRSHQPLTHRILLMDTLGIRRLSVASIGIH